MRPLRAATIALAWAVSASLAGVAHAGSSAGYVSKPELLSGGGGRASSAGYVTMYSLGQPYATGAAASPQYQSRAGFWHAGPGATLVAGVPAASLSSYAVAFGSQSVATTSPPANVVLTNTGSGSLTISSIAIGGAHAADFARTTNCGATLAPAASCQIDVTFTPSAPGARNATLDVATDDPANPTRTATLSGTGVSGGGSFALTVSKAGAGNGLVTSAPAGIDCGVDCSQDYPGGTVVTLTAVQNVTSVFTGWLDCGSVNSSNQCVVTMNAAASVTATFARSGGSATDFNADGRPDIVWSNTGNGATYFWYMNGPSLISDAFVAQIDPSWKVQGVADFNGDGKADIVWRNTANGNTYVWYMDGASFVSDAFVFSLPPEWVIQGVADFNTDNKPDFLMRNVNSGVAFAWFFDNATAIGDQFLFGIDPAWKVEAVADLSRDGQPDLLFRNMGSGLSFAWYTQYGGGNLSLGDSTPPIYSIDPVWEVVQLADWNRDADPDLLFRNRDTGVVFVWYLNGVTLGGSDFIIQIDPSWEIVPRR